jgi:hypothetical protein
MMIYASFCDFITLDIPFSKVYTFHCAPSNQPKKKHQLYIPGTIPILTAIDNYTEVSI